MRFSLELIHRFTLKILIVVAVVIIILAALVLCNKSFAGYFEFESSRGCAITNGSLLTNIDPFAIAQPRGFEIKNTTQNFCYRVLAGTIMSNVEQPDYKVVASKENIEIRDYAPMIVAQVEVSGERKQAISEGFKILADYIFGNNTTNNKMAMTAPVTNELSEKMAMTAPVLQELHRDKWKVRFVMPKKYSIETLPKPNSKDVTLIPLPARRFAVIRFSGLADDENIKQNLEKLEAYMATEKLRRIGEAVFAFYNPPWTLPFLRRNEIMIEIGIDNQNR